MTLDVFQQVFSLSLLSNAAHHYNGIQTDLQLILQEELALAFPKIGDGWQTAWGPVVWKNKPDEESTGPDLSWFIAFNENLEFEDGSVRPAYVVAIAGTPIASEYAWFKVNFAVNTVSDFNAWVAGGIQNEPVVVSRGDIVSGIPYIAAGTVNAVHILLTTQAPDGAASAGTTLLDFLTSLDQSTSPTVIATGHSLGGNLSPSLALALVLSGATPADRTLTYPCAGASPGNTAFTDLFAETLPALKANGAEVYQGWNLNLVNLLDVVPQAWCPSKQISPEQNLGNIPPIYGHPMLPLVLGATIVFSAGSLSSGVLYKPLQSQSFTGTPPSSAPSDLLEFVQALTPQHIHYYLDAAGIEDPLIPVPPIGSAREKTEAEKRLNYPVIAEFEWEYEHPEAAKKIIDEVERSTEGQQLSSEIEGGAA